MKKVQKADEAWYRFDISSIILSVIVLILVLSFFWLLSNNTNAVFGFKEIVFGVALSIVVILVSIWTKKIIIKNKYLGISVGILLLGLAIYGLYFKFKGTYTTIFAILSAMVFLIYFFYIFFRNKN